MFQTAGAYDNSDLDCLLTTREISGDGVFCRAERNNVDLKDKARTMKRIAVRYVGNPQHH